jgi:hypothetical protein
MSRKLFIALIVLSLAGIDLYGQDHTTAPDPKATKKYINKTYKMLKKETGVILMIEDPPVVTDIEGYQSTSYRVTKRTMIRCTNGDYIIIQPHSSHQDTGIGDVSIAVSNTGEKWVNYSHVCGGIIHFKSNDTELPKSTSDFFLRFKGEDDHGKDEWIPWKPSGKSRKKS